MAHHRCLVGSGDHHRNLLRHVTNDLWGPSKLAGTHHYQNLVGALLQNKILFVGVVNVPRAYYVLTCIYAGSSFPPIQFRKPLFYLSWGAFLQEKISLRVCFGSKYIGQKRKLLSRPYPYGLLEFEKPFHFCQ